MNRRMIFRRMCAVGCVLLATWALGATAADDAKTPATEAAPPLPEMTNSLGMKLALIPAGRFVMGSPPGEWGRGRNEEPQREVTITRPFFMSRTEVTNEAFLKFVDETGYRPAEKAESDAQFLEYARGKSQAKYKDLPPGRPDHPITWVSWFAACRFCNWLSEKEGRPAVYVFHEAKDKGGPPRVEMARPYEGGYRLPTEAEWEYAARAGTTTAFSFGEDDRRYGEHAHSYVVAAPSGAVGNDAVNARKPNPWGLYQMHGNAHEWCWDWYAPLYDLTRTQDPTGPDAGVFRVNRGGAMRLPPNYGRSAARMMDDPCATRYDLGFRVVCSPPATTRP